MTIIEFKPKSKPVTMETATIYETIHHQEWHKKSKELWESGQYDEAIEALHKAIEIIPVK